MTDVCATDDELCMICAEDSYRKRYCNVTCPEACLTGWCDEVTEDCEKQTTTSFTSNGESLDTGKSVTTLMGINR